MGLGVSVHETYVVNTVGTVLPEFTDQEVSLLFRGFWRRRAVPIGRTYGTGQLSLRPLHGKTCKYERVVVHVRGGEGFPGQICDPVLEIVMTRRDKAAPLAIEGVTNGEFGVVAVTVLWEVWGL